MKAKPRVGLSTWLVLLVIGAVLPLLVLAGVTFRRISEDSRALSEQGQAKTTRALALAVDGEVRSWKTALMALAASRSLQPGRLGEFYEEAREAAAQLEGWIVLTDAHGHQVLNTLRPYGTPLPATTSPEALGDTLKDGKPMVSDIFFGKVSQRFVVAVTVPVVRDGKVVYALTLTVGPERLNRLLQGQQLPVSWVAAIQDRQRKVVARSVLAEARVGKPVVEWFAAATRAAESGIATGPLIDGRPGRVAFQRLQEVPWVVALAVPSSELRSAAPIWRFVLIALILGLAAVGMAVYFGRKVTTPVARMAQAGEQMLRGEAVDHGVPSAIREVRDLQQALVEASAAVQAYYRERERAAVAEETARVAAAAEQALRESREDLNRAQAVAQTGSWRLDTRRNELRWSDETYRMFGIAPGTPLTYETFLGSVHPEDRKDVDEKWTAALRGEPYDLEHRIVVGDSVKWVRERAELEIDKDGALLGGFGTTQDITDRKRLEEKLHNLAKFPSENPHPVLRVTQDGTLLYANAASAPLLRLWGCQVGQPLPAAWRSRLARAYDASCVEEVEVTCDDRVYACILTPVASMGYINLYGRDITTRKRMEEALRQARDEFELRVKDRTAELSQAVQQLDQQARQLRALTSELARTEQRERGRLAELIHDGLQQLLVGARLRVDVVARSDDSRVRQGCQEIGDLLDEAIAGARSLTGELSPPILQIGGLLPALEWLARWMREKHQLTVGMQPPAAPLPALPEDLTLLLFHAVRELLFNIVKHAQVKAAEVTLDRRNHCLMLTVSDAGAGFHPGSLRMAGGTGGGFGLFSIRQRLELLGGHLEIESAPGRGSRVTLVVPLRHARPDQPPSSNSAPPPPAPETGMGA